MKIIYLGSKLNAELIASGILMIFSLGLWMGIVMPLRQRIIAVTQENFALHRLPDGTGRSSLAPSRRLQLNSFIEMFPNLKNLPELSAQIYSAANDDSLILEQGTYKLVESSAVIPLSRYEIYLPVRGPYERVRGFISHILFELPALSLNEVVLSRSGTVDQMVDAELRMTLYLKVK